MIVDVVVGLQRGDEGKGKIVQYLADQGDYDYVARWAGGANAGHTCYVNGEKIVTHYIPTGILSNKIKKVFMCKGMVADPTKLLEEIKYLESLGYDVKDKLVIDPKITLIEPRHYAEEIKFETNQCDIGTTRRGIGPAYSDKYKRASLRLKDFQDNYLDAKDRFLKVADYVQSADNNLWLESLSTLLLNYTLYPVQEFLIRTPGNVLCEGAQGYELDIDADLYPYVSSSHGLAVYATIGLGVSPKALRHVYGVVKPYSTYVGNGPFLEELPLYEANELRALGSEYGATTGRPRRIGGLHIASLAKAIYDNQVTHLIFTKVDIYHEYLKKQAAVEHKAVMPLMEYVYLRDDGFKQPLWSYKYFDVDKLDTNTKTWARNYFLPLIDQLLSERLLYTYQHITPIPKVSYLSIGPNLDDIIGV